MRPFGTTVPARVGTLVPKGRMPHELAYER